MKNKSKILIAGLMGAIVALAILVVFLVPSLKKATADINPFLYFAATTNSGTLCVRGASTKVIGTTTNRTYLRVSNLSAGSMFLSFGIPAATSTGIYLAASSSIEFSQSNILPTAELDCITDLTNATATIEQIP